MSKKRLIITSVISIVLVAILMIGSTYSVFTSSEIDETANVYKTGVLDVVYTVSEDNVQLTNVEPMTVEEGETVYPYRITVTNNGTVPYQFDVFLNNTTAGNSISNQYIMTKVGYLDAKLLSNCTDNIIKEDVVVLPGTSVDVDVRVWIDSSITNSEIGKSFYAKLSIDGLAVYSDEEEIDNSDLALIYMDGFHYSVDRMYFRNSTYSDKIKNVSFVDYINTNTAEIEVQWDMSVDGKLGTVIAWLEDNDENLGYYDLYIGAKQEIYAKSLSYFFDEMTYIDNISFNNLNTALTNNMNRMFYQTGYSSTGFTLDLGKKFDTGNVTNMNRMFSQTGYSSTGFTLDLGEKFDTRNVTDMEYMFYQTGYSSTGFTLDLGKKFDTSSVSVMRHMFSQAGYSSTGFTLDLGEKFDTGNVTNMNCMFYQTGYSSTGFTLDLGKKFDTSNVEDMDSMFRDAGYNDTEFTLDLGEKFDTSNVEDMGYMFYNVGRKSTGFTLNLGEKFDTSNVEDMGYMFYYTGYSSTGFTLDLGEKFNTSNVNNMSSMFRYTGYLSTIFTLDFGSSFNTSKVTNTSYMFYFTGYKNNNLVLDFTVGSYDNFNFSATTYTSMFYLNKNATILVRDSARKNWILDKGFSNLTDSNIVIA